MRHRSLHALVPFLVLGSLIASPAAAVAQSPTNDVPLDMEVTVAPQWPEAFGPLTVSNVYWSSDWDAAHPSLTRADIDAATRALFDSGYEGKLQQYGVGNLTFGTSMQSICGDPAQEVHSPDVFRFVMCQDTFSQAMPRVNHIYNILLPRGVSITDEIGAGFENGTCHSGRPNPYGAYHAFVPGLVNLYFTVLPLDAYGLPPDCTKDATGDAPLADVMAAMSHEVVEAATDPVLLAGWIDAPALLDDILGYVNQVPSVLRRGEAADICEGLDPPPGLPSFARVPFEAGGIPMAVAAYWSNEDNACVVGGSRVVAVELDAQGDPNGEVTIELGGVARQHPIGEPVAEGTAYSFPSEVLVLDEVSGGFSRLVRGSCTGAASGTIAFPEGNTTADPRLRISCSYAREHYLTVSADPAAAATGNSSLTPSGWRPAYSLQTVTTDAFAGAGPGERFRFDRWEGGATGTSTSATVAMYGPRTAIAKYIAQHEVRFDQVGIASGVTWNVTVAGTSRSGPYAQWYDDGSFVWFAFDQTVTTPSGATRYVLQGTTPSGSFPATQAATVLATYATEHRLTVRTSGLGTGSTNVTNGTTVLGSATDTAPMTTFLPQGTLLQLGVDPVVYGPTGSVSFFRGWVPIVPVFLTAPTETTAVYLSMTQTIEAAMSSGQITDPQVGKALRSKWKLVDAALTSSDRVTALTEIEGFVALLKAQAGKGKLPYDLSVALRLDALRVYQHTLCEALASGQIGASTYATKYTYYASTVTSLGGTAEANC